MQKAACRVLDAIVAGEVIGVYSDYDGDGIPAAAALVSTLKAFGHERLCITHQIGIRTALV